MPAECPLQDRGVGGHFERAIPGVIPRLPPNPNTACLIVQPHDKALAGDGVALLVSAKERNTLTSRHAPHGVAERRGVYDAALWPTAGRIDGTDAKAVAVANGQAANIPVRLRPVGGLEGGLRAILKNDADFIFGNRPAAVVCLPDPF